MSLENILNIEIFDNSIFFIAIAIGTIILLILFSFLFQFLLARYLKKWAIDRNFKTTEFIIELIQKNISPILYFGSFWLGIQILTLPEEADLIISSTGKVFFSFFFIRGSIKTIQFFLKTFLAGKDELSGNLKTLKVVFPAISIFIWIFGFLFLMDNIGFDISGLVAGLGVGGVAVAIASQSMLGDIFNYFTIILDRPFEIDDFIIFDDVLGVVEHVGLKSTRIRSLWGEQIVLSNTDLINSRIKNYKRMQERRVEFKFGIEYSTELEKLKEIPDKIKQIISELENTRFDRAHFFKYAEYYLEFIVVYYIYGADYNLYMDLQQEINLALKEYFLNNNINFAFPTNQIIWEKKRNHESVNNESTSESD